MSDDKGFTLRLLFEGICAFVPDQPFFYRDGQGKPQVGKPSSLAVLLPDARIAGIADWETQAPWSVEKPCYRASHVPLLSLNPGNVAGSSGMLVHGFFNDPRTGEMRVLHVLDNEALTFESGTAQWPRLSFESTIPDPEKPLPGDCPQLRRSLWWLPRLSEISPPHEWCDAGLLTASPKQFPDLGVACRIDLPGGHLSTAAFNKDGTESWEYGPLTRGAGGKLQYPPDELRVWRKAIGNEILCEIEIPDTEVVLNLEDDNGNKASATLRPGAGRKVVEVRIANAELDAVVLRPESLPAATPLPDADFQAFYPFATASETKPWPAPLSSSSSIQPGIHEKPCSGSAFSGSRVGPAAKQATP